MSKSFKNDLTGKRFGRLTVLEFVPNDRNHSYWKCQCECGNMSIVRVCSLKSGHTKSCGCILKTQSATTKPHTTHGFKGTKIYRTWENMKNRCYNSNISGYKYYGGKGISVCDEWRNDFMAFCNWAMNNGYSDDLTIDRIDVNGNYCPENCRWVDMKTQCNNKRNNIIVEYQGEKMALRTASRKLGISYNSLYSRYNRGDRGDRLFRTYKK